MSLAVSRRRGRHQLLEEALRCVCDGVHGTVESLLVRLRRLREPADLAHVLQRGGMDVLFPRRWFEVVERLDVSAHAERLARAGTPNRYPAEL
jgi:hypothetical protein